MRLSRLKEMDGYSGGIGFSRNTDHSSIMAKGRQEYFDSNVDKWIDSDCFYFFNELGSKVIC